MEPWVRDALRAIDEAVAATRREPPFEITPEYAENIRRVMALPENQDGADKSWIWPAYLFCRRHWARAVPQ